jgi:DNA modification methylase
MPKLPAKPYWTTADNKSVKLYQGDVFDVLKRLPEKSVQMVVTSPPYWGLRDYQVDGQLGLEKTPEEFIDKMVEVFSLVHRVLRDDGTLWLNLGDTYSGGQVGRSDKLNGGGLYKGRQQGWEESMCRARGRIDLPPGNLVGTPWRVALALQANGWILRQDIVWHKPSPMPESVRNRCTKAHEYIFLLTKFNRYFYDAEAIREKTGSEMSSEEYQELIQKAKQTSGFGDWYQDRDGRKDDGYKSGNHFGGISPPGGRNKRSVWTVVSEPYDGAHFATFPRKLIEPCILAGTSEKGACVKCGAPWRRIMERTSYRTAPEEVWTKTKKRVDFGYHVNEKRGMGQAYQKWRDAHPDKTLGWEPSCDCGTEKTRPCIVLDPFVGSGTTCYVSLVHGRWSWGIDLSEVYLRDNAIPRIEGAILSRPKLARKLLGERPKRLF